VLIVSDEWTRVESPVRNDRPHELRSPAPRWNHRPPRLGQSTPLTWLSTAAPAARVGVALTGPRPAAEAYRPGRDTYHDSERLHEGQSPSVGSKRLVTSHLYRAEYAGA